MGGVTTLSITQETSAKTQAHEAIRVSEDHKYTVPKFTLIPKGEKTVVNVKGKKFEVPIGDVKNETLESEEVNLQILRYYDEKFDNPDIPEVMRSKKYKKKSKELTVVPELRVRDFGEVTVNQDTNN